MSIGIKHTKTEQRKAVNHVFSLVKTGTSVTKARKLTANKFNISISTAWYWSSSDYRQKQRAKNRKRLANTPEDKARARVHAKARYYEKDKEDHLRDRIKRSMRENNYLIYGKKRSYWQQNFPHLFENIPNAKLDGLL